MAGDFIKSIAGSAVGRLNDILFPSPEMASAYGRLYSRRQAEDAVERFLTGFLTAEFRLCRFSALVELQTGGKTARLDPFCALAAIKQLRYLLGNVPLLGSEHLGQALRLDFEGKSLEIRFSEQEAETIIFNRTKLPQ